jgi:hypothetical protein
VANEAQLNAALTAIDLTGSLSAPGINYTISFSNSFTLATELYAVNLPSDDTLTIQGNGDTLDGGGVQRGSLSTPALSTSAPWRSTTRWRRAAKAVTAVLPVAAAPTEALAGAVVPMATGASAVAVAVASAPAVTQARRAAASALVARSS